MKIINEAVPEFNQFAEFITEKSPEIVEKDVLVGNEKKRVPLSSFADSNAESMQTILTAYQEDDTLITVVLDDTEVELLKEKYHDDVVAYATQSKTAIDVIAKLKEIVSKPVWKVGVKVKIGEVYLYSEDKNLYEVVQAHATQSDWTPDITKALFKKYYEAQGEFPEWVQPTGGHDAYNKGDQVSYKDAHWETTIDANVWAPGVYGWVKI